MTIDDKIRDKKLQYDINRVVAKIALSSLKIDKYEYLTGEETLPSKKGKLQNKFTKFLYSPLGKAFEKQTKRLKNKEENKQMLLQIKMKDQRS